jgi:site-specific recombinase XerC
VHDLQDELSPPSVKQHLAAIRMLFDWLVTGHVIEANPAHSVRGPRYTVKKGKAPVLTAEEAHALLDSIPVTKNRRMIERRPPISVISSGCGIARSSG